MFRAHLQRLAAARYRRRWTDRRIARGRYSMSLFVWYFGTDAARRMWRTTRSCWGRATARCWTTSSSIMCWPRISACICTVRRRPMQAWRRLAATRSTCCHPCRIWIAAPTGRRQRRPTGGKIARALVRIHPARAGERDRVLPHDDPAGFPDRLLSYKGAAFGLEPLLTQSAWFRPHNESEEVDRLYLVGAGTHPGAGLPGVLSSARVLDRVVPDARVFA